MNYPRTLKTAVIILLCAAYSSFGQDHTQLLLMFESAAAEFKVPSDILKGIAFAETRWQHLTWAPGDTASCMGMPHAYGVMSLRDDPSFGHSLLDGANLIGQSVQTLKDDPLQNIRGAAALLSKLHTELPLPEGTTRGDIESWQNAIAAYCGIPQPELAHQHTLEIYERLAKGYHDFGIKLEPRPINLARVEQTAKVVWMKAQRSHQLNKKTTPPDYPEAKWAQAYPGTGNNDQHWYTTGYQRDFVVIHDMEGYYLSVISYFQLASTQASVYYDINGLQDSPADAPAGDITQQVEEKYWAWHARCWNRYMFGIEHEGFVSNPAWYTIEMYLASAKLTKYLCDKYGIPKDRNHIISHSESYNTTWKNWVNTTYNPQLPASTPAFDPGCNNHTDPGEYWDWSFYMQMVKEDKTPPRVTSIPPTDSIRATDGISITFDQRMNPNTVQTNFKISPVVAGAFTWTALNRTLTFKPAPRLEPKTAYTVTVDTGAHNYLNVGLDVNNDGIGGDTYTFTLNTAAADTAPPVLASSSPSEGQVVRSSNSIINLTFNELIDLVSVSNFDIQISENGAAMNKNIRVWQSGNRSSITLWPANGLQPGRSYKVTAANLKDIWGNKIATPIVVNFTVASGTDQYTTIDDFNSSVSNWFQPTGSGSTTGVIPGGTSFAFSITQAFPYLYPNGGAAQLSYSWKTDTTGWLLREYLSAGTPRSILWRKEQTKLQVYVYGDGSGTLFRFAIDDSVDAFPAGRSENHEVSSWTPIDWVGWKLVEWDLERDPAGTWLGNGKLEGQLRFDSFQLSYAPGTSAASGTIYFDQLQLATTSSVTNVGRGGNVAPTTFRLLQNFPNPFNPSTTIGFEIPRLSHVKLSVFDMLGQEIATLANDEFEPGVYRFVWNATSMPSGVYFYRFETPGYVNTQKMILMK